jgi:hypothetical protein
MHSLLNTGVVMWEILSFGRTPYQGLSNVETAEKVENGYRLEAPESASETVYKLMLR